MCGLDTLHTCEHVNETLGLSILLLESLWWVFHLSAIRDGSVFHQILRTHLVEAFVHV